MSSQFLTHKAKRNVIGVLKDNERSKIVLKKTTESFNQLHNSRIHESIWKWYSRSIALADTDSETLELAYSYRSAILLHMSKYSASLMDIDRALSTKNTCLRIKLLIRKAKCLHALGLDDSKNAITEAESLLETEEDLKKIFFNDINETKWVLKEHFEHLKTQNNSSKRNDIILEILSDNKVDDFSYIQIRYTENNGRQVIAAENIKPGDIIYTETPYIHCVNLENTHLYCYHCLTTTWASIPCNYCAQVMFCSEQCKINAWKQYHSIECSLFSCRVHSYTDNCTQLAIKALCQALTDYGGIGNLKAEIAQFENCKDKGKGFVKNGEIGTSGFKTMYSLSSDVTQSKIKRYERNIGFFFNTFLKKIESSRNEPQTYDISNHVQYEDQKFLKDILLKLSTATDINKLEMWNRSYECPNGSTLKIHCCKSKCCAKGIYIAPVTSLINHSCNPNVDICYSNDHKAIVYAIEPITKGMEILRCYQDEYFLVKKSIRKQNLKNFYSFECKCIACLENWQCLLFTQYNQKKNVVSRFPKVSALPSKYERIISSTFNGSADYNIEIIDYLSQKLEETQSSLEKVILIRTLNIVFNQFYGIMLFVPSTCNSEIKYI